MTKEYNMTINDATIYQTENSMDTLNINESIHNISFVVNEYSFHELDTLKITFCKDTQNKEIEYHGLDAYPTRIVARFIKDKENNFLELDIALLSIKGNSYHITFNEGTLTVFYHDKRDTVTPILKYDTKNPTLNNTELNTYMKTVVSEIATRNIGQSNQFYIYSNPLSHLATMLENIMAFLKTTKFPPEVTTYLNEILKENKNLMLILTPSCT